MSSIEAHPLKKLMDQGLRVTINSDDPSYFGGYLNDNFKACQAALSLTAAHITDLARNSFTSAFVGENDKHRYLQQLDEYVAHFS